MKDSEQDQGYTNELLQKEKYSKELHFNSKKEEKPRPETYKIKSGLDLQDV